MERNDAMNSEADRFLEDLSRPASQEIVVAGRLLKPGSRVRLRPRPGGDVLDGILAGRFAVIEGIEEDYRGKARVAVILEEGPGRDLTATRHPAHRYFFALDEIEPLGIEQCVTKRVLVAGIGNVFLGDDGFGVEVTRRLASLELPQEIEVADFGIRGLDLAYALGQPYEAAILVDSIAGEGVPGHLQVIEPQIDEDEPVPFNSHQLHPHAVLRLARRLGALPAKIFVVGCKPLDLTDGESMSMNLSDPVAAAVDAAVELVLKLASRLLSSDKLVTAEILNAKQPE